MKRRGHSVIALKRLVFAIFTLVASTVSASALTSTSWTHDPSSSGAWNDPLNWTAGAPTTANYYAYVDNGGTAVIAADNAVGYISVGESSYHSGHIEQIGGTNTVSGNLYLGAAYNSTGTYTLRDGTLTVNSEQYAGPYSYGTGIFTQSGGVHSVSHLYLGGNGGGTGTYNLIDGQIYATEEYVSYYGTGIFNQTGGTHTVGKMYVGGFGSTGTYHLEDGVVSATDEYLGWYQFGPAVFTQTDGTNTVSGHLHIGWTGPTTYNFLGGSLSAQSFDINNGYLNIDVTRIDCFRVSGNKVALLNGYIANDKIYDNTLVRKDDLWAVYDAVNNWTTLEAGLEAPVVPEPGALALIAPALLGFAGMAFRKMRRGRS